MGSSKPSLKKQKEEFLKKERKVQKLTDVETLFPFMKNSFDFISSLLKVNETTINSLYNSINETNVNSAYETLEYGLIIRFVNTKHILSLLSLLSTKFGYKRNPSGYIRYLLIHQGLIKNEKIEKNFDKIFHFFKEGSIEKIIQEDDFDKFIELTSKQSFDGMKEVITDSEVIGAVQDLSSKPNGIGLFGKKVKRFSVTYLQLMAFFGSIKCFRHAINTDAFSINNIAKYAVAGGNKEILHILEQKNISFDNCFEVSVKYHRYEVSDWLLTYYKCEKFDITKS